MARPPRADASAAESCLTAREFCLMRLRPGLRVLPESAQPPLTAHCSLLTAHCSLLGVVSKDLDIFDKPLLQRSWRLAGQRLDSRGGLSKNGFAEHLVQPDQ
jgi:hypothetical protein